MAKEPKKLNLKSKIDTEESKKKNVEVVKPEIKNEKPSTGKKAPKKLNLKSKIEEPKKEILPEIVEEIKEEIKTEEVSEVISFPVIDETTEVIEDDSENVIIGEPVTIGEPITISDNEEVVDEDDDLIDESIKEEFPEITIMETEITEEDTESVIDNNEDSVIIEDLADEAIPAEVSKEEILVESIEPVVTPVIEKTPEVPVQPVTPVPQASVDASTLALLTEIVAQNAANGSPKAKRAKRNTEMEIEYASHLNGHGKADEGDNLSTTMSVNSHGLTDDEIREMPFAKILTKILEDEDVTDVQFNGKDLFIQNNKKGRYLFSHLIDSRTVENFVRDITNTLNNQFNTENPIIDCEIIDAYSKDRNKVLRLNAVHESISPYGNTMSIRITQPALRLSEQDEKFASVAVFKLLEAMIRGNLNILISGRTGSGKTELQKFLIKNIRDAETIVLIEDTKDTNLKELYPEKNITSWITNTKIKQNIDFDALIKASLRNNPDWIIISETRSSEAYSMIKSGLSGHKIITTLHSDSAETNVDRLIHMCKEKYDLDQLLLGQMITSVFDIGVHIDYDVTDEGIIRYICEIVEYKGYDEAGVDVEKIFEVALQPVQNADGSFTYQKVYKYGKISEELFSKLAKKKVLTPEISRFIKEEYYGKEI